MNHSFICDYQNVCLRPLEREDIEFLRNWRNTPENTKYLKQLPYITSVMQQEWYNKYLTDKDEIILAVIETDQLKRLVGSLSLYNIREKECIFGKILIGDPEAHGRKIGANATIAALMIAFNLLNMETVHLYVYADNLKAIKVYNEAGFRISDRHEDRDGKLEYKMTVQKGDWVYE